MKICWDNIDKLRLNRNFELVDKYNNKFIEKDSCKLCGESYLSLYNTKGDYCSKKCSSIVNGKLHENHTEESKEKIRYSSKLRYKNKENHPFYGKLGESSSNWKGGCNLYIHRKARELFGQDKCEICGMTNEDHKKKTGYRLSMHCDGHRYKNLERIFWTTCCEFECHKRLEAI